jgi:lipopolysaccharide transport system ATP-binding protein
MNEVILKAKGIGKQYRLGLVGTGTLRDDLNRWWYKIRGKEDPFLKIGEKNDRSTIRESNYIWALRDINFEVENGEVLGIIGKNGAGKSTLLKILSRVTSPTTGEIKSKGRIASLLEVGTGFHPEMTGRENIYLNGAILGMTKAEIKQKEEDIIAFSGCTGYIDTPVKRYSSGMTVRLAFAVAAHLEPDILVIDEVLAVGDAEFQKKAIGKMQDISKGGGRTVLFVSHNMAAIKSLCTRCIVLDNGEIVFMGSAEESVENYLTGDSEFKNYRSFNSTYNRRDFILHEIHIKPKGIETDFVLDEYQEIEINTLFTLKNSDKSLHITFVLNNENGDALFTFSHINSNIQLKKGLNKLKCILPEGFLNIGTYYLSFYVIQDSKSTLFVEKDIMAFNIQHGERPLGSWLGREPGFIKPKFNWSLE